MVQLVIAVVEAVTFCIRKLPMSFLTGALYLISGVAVLCVGLEIFTTVSWDLLETSVVGDRADDLCDRGHYDRDTFVPEKTAQCSTQTASFLTGGIYGTGRKKQ